MMLVAMLCAVCCVCFGRISDAEVGSERKMGKQSKQAGGQQIGEKAATMTGSKRLGSSSGLS